MAKDLTFVITSITEPDYDDVDETVKIVEPCIEIDEGGAFKIGRVFSRLDSESDADSKTAIQTILTDLGYDWDTVEGV